MKQPKHAQNKHALRGRLAGAGLLCLAAFQPASAQGIHSAPGAQTGSVQSSRDSSGASSDASASSGNDAMQQAYKDYSAKNFSAAIPELQAIVKKSPKTLNAYKMLANIYLQQNQVPQAIPAMEAVVRLDPKDSATRSNLGIAYLQTGEAAKAAGVFHSLLIQNPKNADYTFQYADSLEKAGKHAAAAAAFEKAAALNPADSRALLYAGQIYHQEVGDDAKAVPDLQAALARGESDKFSANTALAEAANAAKRHSDAIEYYTQAALAKPDDFGTKYNLGVLEQNAGKPAAAEAAYRQALTLKAPDSQSSADLQENLAGLLTSDGKLDEAAALLTQAAQADPASVSVQNELGSIYEKQNKKGLALAAYKQALALSPSDAAAKDGVARLSKP